MNEILHTHSVTGNKIGWGPNEAQIKIQQEKKEIADWIEKLTNWQRSQWARGGYKRDLESIQKYAMMLPRPKNAWQELGRKIGS